MLASYFRSAVRRLGRDRVVSAINILGLSVGVACCILIVLFVGHERSYDRHVVDGERVARLVRESSALSAGPMGPALVRDLPGVEVAARLDFEDGVLIRPPTGDRFTDRLFFADSTWFDVVPIPFVEGDPSTALDRPESLVLSESAARRLFGGAPAMGRSLDVSVDGQPVPLTVTAVVRDQPSASHFRFDLMASFHHIETASRRMENWSTNWLYTYLLLTPSASPGAVQAALPEFFRRNTGEAWTHFRIQSLHDIHLGGPLRFDIEAQGNLATVWIFSAIAFLVLLIAGINFTNLATAVATRRAREVGMRKALGATRGQLMGQFTGETVLLAVLSAILAIGFAALALPAVASLAGAPLERASLLRPGFLASLAAGATVLGLVAGSYPAFVLSAFEPVRSLRGAGSDRKGAFLRKTLVVVQFAVSCALILGTLIVSQQLRFMRDARLGFEPEQVVVVPLDDELEDRHRLVRGALGAVGGVLSVSASSNTPGEGVSDFLYRPEGLPGGEDDLMSFDTYFVDGRFGETLRMETTRGRWLDESRPQDENGFLLNEEALALIQSEAGAAWENPIGRQLDFYVPGSEGWEVLRSGPVVGIVRDFHYRSLREEIGPLILQSIPETYDRLLVRVATDDLASTVGRLEEAYAQFAPARPFEYRFLDRQFDDLYQTESRTVQLFGWFAGLAVLIACLGLFGLSAFMAERRRREVGIRKVFGAGLAQIVGLMARDFLLMVLLAAIIAVPAAWLAASRWLEGFAYKTDLGPGPFVLATFAALAVALATVSFQSLRAASANPIDSLRDE